MRYFCVGVGWAVRAPSSSIISYWMIFAGARLTRRDEERANNRSIGFPVASQSKETGFSYNAHGLAQSSPPCCTGLQHCLDPRHLSGKPHTPRTPPHTHIMGRGRGFEFWCCAIPLINVGSYVTVVEIALVGFITGILAVAGDPFVAGLNVIPTFAKGIVAALGFITCAWQIVGIVAIKREATKLYHIYVRITTLLTLAVLAVTIAFFAVAASQHSKAQAACNSQYGALPSTTSTGFTNSDITQNFGNQICNYFIWAQVGTMGALIILIGLVQLYMCFALRAYGVAQRAAYRDFKASGGAMGSGKDDEIPLSSRNVGAGNSEIWDPPRETRANPHGVYEDDDAAAARRYSATSPTSPTYAGYGHGVGSTAPASAPYGSYDADHTDQHSAYPAPYGNTAGYPAYAGGPGARSGGQAYPAYPAY